MHGQAQPHPPDTSPPTPAVRNGRDLQRAALRELVELSAQCAAEEDRIEQEHSQAVQAIERDFEKTQWAIEERHRLLREETAEKHAQRVARIQQQYDSALRQLREADEAARRRLEHDRESVERDVKQKLEQAAWLAESVCDAAQIKARQDLKKAKELAAARAEELSSLHSRAAKLVETYRQGRFVLPPPPAIAEDPAAAWQTHRQAADRLLAQLEALRIPRLFVGATPAVAILLVLVLAAAVPQAVNWTGQPNWPLAGLSVAIASVVCTALGLVLWTVAKRQVRETCLPLGQALAAAHEASRKQLELAGKACDEAIRSALERRKVEIQAARDKFAPYLSQAVRRYEVSLQAHQSEQARHMAKIDQKREQALRELEEWFRHAGEEQQRRRQEELAANQRRFEQLRLDNENRYRQRRASLEKRWSQGLVQIQAPIRQIDRETLPAPLGWDEAQWKNWVPPRRFVSTVRFGQLRIDPRQVTDRVPKTLKLPESFTVPAALAFPRQASLLIHADHAGRAQGLRTLQLVMARLLTSLPPGRVHFTIIDPVGLGQNFAGFMHLADHDEALVGGRIWTESEHIGQRLANLTEHMETVIQKYLRNEFETIDDYNAQAGELAEPYRFLVVADFPTGFEGDSFRRLNSIATSGARCGVYTLVLRDTRQKLPAGAHLDELTTHSVNLVRQGDGFIWDDEVFRQFPLQLDEPPSEEFLTKLMDVVGRHARQAKRVEVPFETIAPAESEMWSRSSQQDLVVPIGRMGATRLQTLRLGRGVAQHALIAGKTGSGKSTLLHVLVTNLAMWFSPDEVEFYLVDFKKGVEFKTYATHALPHARAIAVESDREFGLSVLQRVDAELARRGDLFRRAGVQDINAYRQATGQRMPRTLLIIDEFQEFFSEDDKLAQDAAVLLDRLVRQGRAFGVHVLLGSQTIGGTSGLSRSTLGQIAVRIALQCSEADSQMILGDNNSAARLLSRPGEAIYNDAGGLVEGNSPFQVSWLPDSRQEQCLQTIAKLAQRKGVRTPPAIVFEGNAPADITKNLPLAALLAAPRVDAMPVAPVAYVGEPVAIKDPTSVTLRRQAGANVLLVGQQEEAAMAILCSAMISLAAQHPRQTARFVVLDGSPVDSPLAAVLPKVKAALPHEVSLVDYRAVPQALAALAEDLQQRQANPHPHAPSVYVLIYGLQRYRALRHQEEAFSFSPGEQENKPQPDRLFADLLREGPSLGIHVLAWCDTPASLERTLERASMREFDHRILFQMSATDSSNLIDSPLANKLGFHRALAYSEEQGTLEKFRPYALPTSEFLKHVAQRLSARPQ